VYALVSRMKGNKILKTTIDYGLHYYSNPSMLEGFIDASLITNSEDHSCTSEWVYALDSV